MNFLHQRIVSFVVKFWRHVPIVEPNGASPQIRWLVFVPRKYVNVQCRLQIPENLVIDPYSVGKLEKGIPEHRNLIQKSLAIMSAQLI